MAKCYNGPNPVDDQDRLAIWKWAKDQGGIDKGAPIEQVHDAINQKFFNGKAKPEWINDILSGRKTPFKFLANDQWKKQYNRRVITQQANEISKIGDMGQAGKILRGIWTLPRSVAVFGHGIVFPVTHAGDLVFRPQSWGTFIKGALRTYRGGLVPSRLGGGKAYTARIMDTMQRSTFEDLGWRGDQRSLYDLGIRSGVDMGPKSRPSGLISRSYHGPAERAWNLLTVMRFELWKKQMAKFVKPGMSEPEMLDIGQNLATWANHATGSAEGIVSKLGGTLFGPKLTQSKISRLTTDVATTVKTFGNWKDATAGEKAVAWTRLSGSTQFVATNLGFLAVNAGLLSALGSKQKVNYTDPTKGDWFGFKGLGLLGYVPGMHTELRTLGKVMVASVQGTPFGKKLAELSPSLGFMGKAPFEGRLDTAYDIAKDYAKNKLTPSISRPAEAIMGENWRGQPLPWSSQEFGVNRFGKPDKTKPRLSYGEYLASIGPIPLEGPIGFVYDQIKKTGASAQDSLAIVKGILVSGIGGLGGHIREETPPTSKATANGSSGQTPTQIFRQSQGR